MSTKSLSEILTGILLNLQINLRRGIACFLLIQEHSKHLQFLRSFSVFFIRILLFSAQKYCAYIYWRSFQWSIYLLLVYRMLCLFVSLSCILQSFIIHLQFQELFYRFLSVFYASNHVINKGSIIASFLICVICISYIGFTHRHASHLGRVCNKRFDRPKFTWLTSSPFQTEYAKTNKAKEFSGFAGTSKCQLLHPAPNAWSHVTPAATSDSWKSRASETTHSEVTSLQLETTTT